MQQRAPPTAAAPAAPALPRRPRSPTGPAAGPPRREGSRPQDGHGQDEQEAAVHQIQDDLKREQLLGKKMHFKEDDDLPGMGQFYCTPCARHFINEEHYNTHCRGKLHRRRMKDVAQEQYSQAEAEAGAGKSREVLPPVRACAPAAAAAAADGAMDL